VEVTREAKLEKSLFNIEVNYGTFSFVFDIRTVVGETKALQQMARNTYK